MQCQLVHNLLHSYYTTIKTQGVPLTCCKVKRCIAGIVPVVYCNAGLDQSLQDMGLAKRSSIVQRCAAILQPPSLSQGTVRHNLSEPYAERTLTSAKCPVLRISDTESDGYTYLQCCDLHRMYYKFWLYPQGMVHAL